MHKIQPHQKITEMHMHKTQLHLKVTHFCFIDQHIHEVKYTKTSTNIIETFKSQDTEMHKT